jgi:hypothetical protein
VFVAQPDKTNRKPSTNEAVRRARSLGYAETLLGRRRAISELMSAAIIRVEDTQVWTISDAISMSVLGIGESFWHEGGLETSKFSAQKF